MREFVARAKQRDVLALIGAGVITEHYDVRSIRDRMTRDPVDSTVWIDLLRNTDTVPVNHYARCCIRAKRPLRHTTT